MIDYATEIKQAVTMRQICERYGFQVNRANKACCPFHADRTPSMQVYDGERGYWCYVCNRGGDVIDFTMRYFNLTFFGAITRINEDFSLHLPVGKKLTPAQRRNAELAAGVRQYESRKREHTLRQAQDAYNDALAAFCDLDRVLIAEQEMVARTREVTPYMASLLKQRTILKYNLDAAEDRLAAVEKERG